jgi:hypothetical protein
MVRRALIALSALACASIACSIFLGGPAYPDPAVPASTEAASGLQSAFQDAMENAAQTGTLTVELTESELTSFLQSKLAQEADPPITQPQVTLREGALQIFGTAQTGIFVANVSLTAQFSVDQNGQPQIKITQAEYGPFPAPSELTEALGALVRETLTGSLGPAALGFRLENITIADGELTLTGRIK